jgi:penicillin-binding protein 1A
VAFGEVQSLPSVETDEWLAAVLGAAVGAFLASVPFNRWLRLAAAAATVAALAALWLAPGAPVHALGLMAVARDLATGHRPALVGFATGLGVALVVAWWKRPAQPAPQAPAGGGFTRRVLIAFLTAGGLWLGVPAVFGAIVNSDRWNLPQGDVLMTLLSSCQVAHFDLLAGADEHLLCPAALRADEIPQVLKDAVVASEDRNFQAHGAIEMRSVMRAVFATLNGQTQGGSTITQQLARSLLLRNEDTVQRKVREAILAVRIFDLLPRDEILARYVNVVPHARNMHGFDEPARYYFGVRARDLNLAESALLVAMLPEPNKRDPLNDPDLAVKTAARVLEQMAAQGKVSAVEARRAEQEIARRIASGRLRRGTERNAEVEYRSYRDMAVREAAAGGLELGPDYRLVLFMDPGLQRRLVEQLCTIGLGHQAAGAFLRPSGEALAVAGSCEYTGTWNRAADISRSVGSAGKLFPLIAARELSISLKRRFPTGPVRGPDWPAEPNRRCVDRPTITLELALEQSCNRPWTALAIELGDRLNQVVARFDIAPPTAASLVPIGGIQTSPLKLARIYASLQNGGRMPEARFLAAAIGPGGNVIGAPEAKPEPQVMAPATAATIRADLRAPVKSGTASAANSVHALVFGKTGTSSRSEDAWFVGLTADLAGALWIGDDAPAPMAGISGGGSPARAFAQLTGAYYVAAANARRAEADAAAAASRAAAEVQRTRLAADLIAVAAIMLVLLLLSAAVRRTARVAPPEEPQSAAAA